MTLRRRIDRLICVLAPCAAAVAFAACSPDTGVPPNDGTHDHSGGAPGSGGAADAGGSSGDTGGTSSGGSDPGSGGSNPGSGGDPGSGGSNPGSGGDPGSGGSNPGSGGDPGSGGSPGSGGNSGDGSTALPAFDAGPDTLNNVTAGNVCQRIAEIQCASQEHCCALPHRSRSECITVQKNGCVDGGLDYITEQSRNAFDAANAPAILKAFEDCAAACDPTIPRWAAKVEGLRGIIKGTLGSGDTCTTPAFETRVEVIGSYLASCADGNAFACLPRESTPWTCTALSPLDGNCFTDVNCDQSKDAHGVYCNNDASPPVVDKDWKCLPRKTVGQSCSSGNQCESLLCTTGATKQNPGTCLEANAANAFCIN